MPRLKVLAMSKRTLLMLTLGATALVALVAFSLYYLSLNQSENNGKDETIATQSGLPNAHAVSAENQARDGANLVVKEVALLAPGYAVIQKVGASDAPAAIVGHSEYLSAGTSKNVKVVLYEPEKLQVGETLLASLRLDDGDRKYGRTDAENIVKDKAGRMVRQTFTLK